MVASSRHLTRDCIGFMISSSTRSPCLSTPMARISPQEFLDLPLRVHSFLRNVPLHDVWVVDLPGGREGITLQEFRSRSRAGRTEDIPYAAKTLLQLRFLLGRIFRLDTPRPEEKSASYIRLLDEADRVCSLVPPGS